MTSTIKLGLVCACLVLGASAQSSNDGNVHVLKVQGNVYMLVGAGGNITAQVGKDGVFLVNAGNGKMNDKVLAALKTLSDKPIHYIIDTSFDPELTGGNADIAKLGAPVMGGNLGQSNHGAAIVASENVLNRMSSPSGQKAPATDSLPGVVFFEGDKEIFFNSEPVITMLAPAAHTDGDTIVFFRRSDVISTGEIFNTVSYPIINLEAGGNVNGVIDALNHVLDIAVPEHEQEGGTYIIPGHGRLCDEHDVLEYRDMVTIVRDRVQTAIKRGMTLEQVKAAGYTKEYDPRWGSKTGPGTTDMFIEAVYKSLKK
jgi:glyoxylase-like metal-dependent hydrolase (beta-lactamase superfamily II)